MSTHRFELPTRGRATLATICALLVIAAGTSAPAAYAAWTVALAGAGTVTAGAITTTSTLSTIDSRVSNDDYQTTHVVEVRNTSPTGSTNTGTSDATLVVNAAAAHPLASVMSVSVWPVLNAAACTTSSAPGTDAVSATWTTGLTSASAAVLPNASAYFCVRGYPTDSTPLPASTSTAAEQNRSVVAARLGSASTQSFIPTFVGQVQRGNFTAASATTPTSTVSTFRIFPYGPLTPGALYAPTVHVATAGLCYNISGGGNLSAPGASLIAYSCSSASVTPRNERFAQLPVPGTDSVQVRADSTDSTYGFVEATADGALVQSQVGDADNLRQRWIPQLLSNGTRQLINAATGYCLFGTGGNASAFTTQPCNNLVGESSTWNTAGL